MRFLSTLIVALLVPNAAQAALSGRIDSAHLDRLRVHANGRIEAESGSFDTAVGRIGGFGFGQRGCDSQGFVYRPIVHSKAVLRVHIPEGSNRLDLIVRPTRGPRELRVMVDNALWVNATLGKGWQRVRIPLDASQQGMQVLELSLTRASESFKDAEDFGPKVLGLFHALVPKSLAQDNLVVEPQTLPVSAPGQAWMEAGEIVEIPIPVQEGQALETAGLLKRGPGELSLQVTLLSSQGAREDLAELGTALNVPWNLDLSRRGEPTPYWLRFDVKGEEGAVALDNPRLTIPGILPVSSRARVGDRPIILIALRNVGLADAEAARVSLDGAFLKAVHTTSSQDIPALDSLLTGRYPAASKQPQPGTAAPKRPRSLAQLATDAGRFSVLVSGVFPQVESAAHSEDYQVVRVGGPKSFGPSAPEVLKEAEKLLIELRKKKTFTTILLGDAAFPFYPRTAAWRRFLSAGNPPWRPADSRRVLLRAQKAGRVLNAREKKFVWALQRGAVAETLRAVRDFGIRLTNRGMKPVIVIAGLGSQEWPPRPDALTPENTLVPLWIQGEAMPAAASRTRADLTDVATTLAGMLRRSKSRMQGSDLRSALPGTWSESAFVRDAFGGRLAIAHDAGILVGPSGSIKAHHVRTKAKGIWKWGLATGTKSQLLVANLLARQLDGWEGAGRGWNPSRHSGTVRLGAEPKAAPICKNSHKAP